MRRHQRVRATPAWSDSSGVTATPNFEPTARARGMEAAASSMAHVEGQASPQFASWRTDSHQKLNYSRTTCTHEDLRCGLARDLDTKFIDRSVRRTRRWRVTPSGFQPVNPANPEP